MVQLPFVVITNNMYYVIVGIPNCFHPDWDYYQTDVLPIVLWPNFRYTELSYYQYVILPIWHITDVFITELLYTVGYYRWSYTHVAYIMLYQFAWFVRIEEMMDRRMLFTTLSYGHWILDFRVLWYFYDLQNIKSYL